MTTADFEQVLVTVSSLINWQCRSVLVFLYFLNFNEKYLIYLLCKFFARIESSSIFESWLFTTSSWVRMSFNTIIKIWKILQNPLVGGWARRFWAWLISSAGKFFFNWSKKPRASYRLTHRPIDPITVQFQDRSRSNLTLDRVYLDDK